MSAIFTDEQLNSLSDEIDRQLIEIRKQPVSGFRKGDDGETGNLPEKQCKEIEEKTKEKPETFLKKFAKAARNDLCIEEGVLYKQWKRWGDLCNKDVLDKFGAVLVTMGFAGSPLQILAVSTAVIVLHLTVKTFCEEYSKEDTQC